jgi:hypothetical protein
VSSYVDVFPYIKMISWITFDDWILVIHHSFEFDVDDLSHDLPPSTLLNDLHSFVNNKELCDVTFILEGQSVYAHKMMLVRYANKGKLSLSLISSLTLSCKHSYIDLFYFIVFLFFVTRSPYFRTMFSGNMMESKQTEIHIKQVSTDHTFLFYLL